MEEYDPDLLRAWTLASSLNFTRYFFRDVHDTRFIVGKHHRIVCDALDDVLNGKCNKLIINISPRYSKTELAVKNFIAMGFAVNPASRFIHLSYSSNLAEDNSVAIRDIVTSRAFRELYPTRITYGKNTKLQWDTDQGGGLYASSTVGQITGFGAGIVEEEGKPYRFGGAIVIDDPIKPEDALSDVVRERVNRRFETTIRNRVNSRNTPIIIIMQRLHEHDLCGYLQEVEPEDWRVISLPVIQINEKGEREALWPHKHTLEELDKIKRANSFVFETQYMQNPTPIEGLMYPHPFKTYEILPNRKLGMAFNYTDTADTGADYLCSICADIHKDGYYVTDVLYTKKPMEYTEQATAQMIAKNETRYCMIESNNGGRAFMRNVERLSREYGNRKTTFMPFTQTKNKHVRIFTQSAEVNNMFVFPHDWERRWPEFATDVKSYRKEGANAHDDACFVAGTRIATLFGDKAIENVKRGDFVLTPFGVRRVLTSGKTGHKAVIMRFGLQVTKNHKVYNANSFKKICQCVEKELSLFGIKEQIIWRLKKLLLLTESNTDLWGRENIILASQRVTKEEKVLKVCMSQFGNFITTRKFRKAIAFIIRMATLLITTLAILSVYQLGNICQTIQRRICRMLNIGEKTRSNFGKRKRRQLNGMEVKRVENGIVSTERKAKRKIKHVFACFVEKVFFLLKSIRSFVRLIVGKNLGEAYLNTKASVCSAAKSSIMENQSQVSQTECSVAIRAKQATPTIIEADVYNITVEKDGCYYANGILVSNCDAMTGILEHANLCGGATDEQIMRDFL